MLLGKRRTEYEPWQMRLSLSLNQLVKSNLRINTHKISKKTLQPLGLAHKIIFIETLVCLVFSALLKVSHNLRWKIQEAYLLNY